MDSRDLEEYFKAEVKEDLAFNSIEWIQLLQVYGEGEAGELRYFQFH
jgi:hypothetical protein